MRDHNADAITGTRAIKDRAANWLQRADAADWTEQDQRELEAWLSRSSANRIAYWRVKSAWERAQRLRVLQPAENERAESRKGKARSPAYVRTVAAALGVFVLLGAGAAFLSSASREQIFSTNVGGHRIVLLADGTKVELNTDTILRATMGAHGRAVTLEKGEAYFQIVHDANRPFTVVAGNRRITDLGTKFLVRREAARFEVALIEGRARVDALNGALGRPVLLAPGDMVVNRGNSIVLTKKTVDGLADELGWRQGVLVFSHATLADAALEFNRYNMEKLVIADPSIAHKAIGGTFKADKVGVFAQLVRNLLGLHVEARGNDIVISR